MSSRHWKWDVPTKFRGRKIPSPQHGHGWSTADEEDDKNFSLDEKTGLYLPESAAKDRRKVKIGFQP